MKEKWITNVGVFIVVFIVACFVFYFLGHYSFWGVVSLSAMVGVFMVVIGIWGDYIRKKQKK
jgi:hypothetical protein